MLRGAYNLLAQLSDEEPGRGRGVPLLRAPRAGFAYAVVAWVHRRPYSKPPAKSALHWAHAGRKVFNAPDRVAIWPGGAPEDVERTGATLYRCLTTQHHRRPGTIAVVKCLTAETSRTRCRSGGGGGCIAASPPTWPQRTSPRCWHGWCGRYDGRASRRASVVTLDHRHQASTAPRVNRAGTTYVSAEAAAGDMVSLNTVVVRRCSDLWPNEGIIVPDRPVPLSARWSVGAIIEPRVHCVVCLISGRATTT